MKNGKYIALLLALVMMMSCLSIPALAEYQAESVVIAADDDSFNVAPWSNSQGEVSNYLQNIIWTHLATRPFTGAMIGAGMELVAAKEITRVDELTWHIVLNDITRFQGQCHHRQRREVQLRQEL